MRSTSRSTPTAPPSVSVVSAPPASGTSPSLSVPTPTKGVEAFGRYLLYPPIARGGMATVHPARLIGDGGFSRLVAVKRLHPQFTDDPEFIAMFHDEAHIASMIHHPNVVPVLDVVVEGQEVILVQEYVHGVPLNQLLKAAQFSGSPIAIDVAVTILCGVLSGLHAAHESRDELGEPLEVVHRDVSPQNVIVSIDGVPRLLDFGIAKARTCAHHTREGVFKGKLAYMAPEQIKMEPVSRLADVYAAGVLAWELFANRRFYQGESDVDFVAAILKGAMPSVGSVLRDAPAWVAEGRGELVAKLDPIVGRALRPNPAERFATALDMRDAILEACPAASTSDVAEWVRIAGAELLEKRKRQLASTTMDESSRSHSRIAAATRTTPMRPSGPPSPPGGIPVSGAVGLTTPMPFSAPPPPPAAPLGIARPSRAPSRASLAGMVPLRALLVTCGALLLLVGLLAGVLFVRGHDDAPPAHVPVTIRDNPPIVVAPAETASAAHEGTQAIAIAPPVTPPRPEPRAETVSVPTTTVRAKAETPTPRWTPPPRPAPPPVLHTPPPPSPPPPAPPLPAAEKPSPKADCNPPFYFEGTKKVFKPACL